MTGVPRYLHFTVDRCIVPDTTNHERFTNVSRCFHERPHPSFRPKPLGGVEKSQLFLTKKILTIKKNVVFLQPEKVDQKKSNLLISRFRM